MAFGGSMRLWTTAVVMLFCASSAFADGVANLLSPGQEFAAALTTTVAIVGPKVKDFVVSVKKKLLYKVTEVPSNFQMGTLLLSNDGRTVVWMLAERFFKTEEKEPLEMPAVVFFLDGKTVKIWKYGELIVRPGLVSDSISHTAWVMETRRQDWSLGERPVKLSPDGKQFELLTSSFRSYVFDAQTGQQLKAEDTPLYREADLIIYGPISSEGARLTSKEFRLVKGTWPKSKPRLIEFKDPTRTYLSDREMWATVSLKQEGQAWVVSAKHWEVPMIYNRLTD